MLVTAVQTLQHAAFLSGKPEDTLRGLEEGFRFLDKAAAGGSRLLVTIEGWNCCGNPADPAFPGRIEQINRSLYPRLEELSRRRDCCIAAGIYTVEEGRLHNSVVLFDRGGIAGTFHKVHLPAGEEVGVTPGSDFSVFETSVGRVGPLVCWDLQYPESARILAMKGADVIVCPTWGWEEIFRCRAYENSVPMVIAMGIPESGVLWDFCAPSCVVDNMGRILAEAPRNVPCFVTAELPIGADPAPQYGSGEITGLTSMRAIRLSQRRPDAYGYLTEPHPALEKRYFPD